MKRTLIILAIMVFAIFNTIAQTEFITTWYTYSEDDPEGTTFTIPTNNSYTYNYDVDWDNDGTFDEFGLTGNVTHDFDSAGSFTIRIQGTFPAIYFRNSTEADKIKSVDQWGAISWESMEGAFEGCYNLDFNATDVPDLSNVTNMSCMLKHADGFSGDISGWDVSNVTNMGSLFYGVSSFNENIGSWDVSNVKDMSRMFFNVSSFSHDISSWNVDSVTTTEKMFYKASSFSADLSNWNLSNATNFAYMFNGASSFNSDISSWDVGSAQNMTGMFTQATIFNQDLSSWDITALTAANNMFDESGLSDHNYNEILKGWGAQSVQDSVSLGDIQATYCNSEYYRDILVNTHGWTINDNGQSCNAVDFFITTWYTDPNSTNDTTITIPKNNAYTYMYDVDWNNDGVFDTLGVTGSITHAFDSVGTYTIAIRGTFPAIYFNNSGDKQKLLSIDQWGDLMWESMQYAFHGCSNMVINATDAPDLSNTTNLQKAFQGCSSLSNEDLSNWDVSSITDMSNLFYSTSFNGNISTWNTSNVTNLSNCFNNNKSFNGDISSWDVSNVTSLQQTFYKAISFNQDISGWDVSNVVSLERTFYRAGAFEQDLSSWDVSSVINMSETFREASKFNSDLSQWNTSSVTTMIRMFQQVPNFDADISFWDVSNVTNMSYMFSKAYVFDQDLSNWDVSNLQYATGTFTNTSLSQQNYDKLLMGWSELNLQDSVRFDVYGVNYCHGTSSRQHIIDTFGWTINDAGESCNDTNYFVTTWKTDNTSGPHGSDKIYIPTNPAYSYLYDVDWDNNGVFDTLGVTGDFEHDYGIEGEYKVQIRGKFPSIYFNNSGNKDKLISIDQWGTISWKTMEAAFRGCENMTYNATDAPDLSNVTSLELTFSGCTLFNGDVSNWDVSNIETMWATFANAENFNQDIGNWDVSSVEDMIYTFLNATSFDQDLSSWDITSLGNAADMFEGASLSISNYDALLEGWSQQAVKEEIDFGAGNSQYCNSADAKDTLEIKYGWIIFDGGIETIVPSPDNTTLADIIAECEITSLTAPTATDNCTDTVYATHDADLPITEQGTTVVTWTYTDANGNETTQTQNVIIDDITAPVPDLDNLPDIIAECEVISLTAPVATDNCSDTVYVTHDAVLPITLQDTTIVTWTYEDEQGNTSTQTQNVIIDDVTAPIPDLTDLPNITAECEVASLEAPTATDNCSDTVYVSHDAVLPIISKGTTIVTWTYNDGNGNLSTQTQNVVIEDVTAPVPDHTGLLVIKTFCEVTELTAPTATDNCEGLINGTHNAVLPITTQGTTIVTWTYTDSSGNSSTQDQIISISDILAPVPDEPNLSDISAFNEVTELIAPTATDDCVGEVIGTHDVVLPITTQGTTVVTWTYDDGHGNPSTQTQNVIIIVDNEAPIPDIDTLSDIVAECEISELTAPTATDNYSGTITGTHNINLPISTSTQIIWTYDDGNGNTSTQTQDVIIEDITAPATDNVNLDDVTAECEITELTPPTATDNCDGTIFGAHNASFPIIETTLVIWTYTDGSGNSSTQTQYVVIEDITAPVLDLATLEDVTAECEVTELTAPTATDNCEGTIFGTHNATLPVTETMVITWTYTDFNGNAITQTQNVIIEDVTAPVPDLASLTDITAECEVEELTAPTATDNCSGIIMGIHNATLPITEQGTTVVTWTYDDGNGNISTQTQNIVIEDNIAPVLVCNENQNVNADESNTYTVQGNEFDPIEISDNCAIESLVNNFNNNSTLDGSQLEEGVHEITWTATDIAGNETSCTIEVTVNEYIGLDEVTFVNITVYPNPTYDFININLGIELNNVRYSLSNVYGERILMKEPASALEKIDLTPYQPGVYFLTVSKSDKLIETFKVIKK